MQYAFRPHEANFAAGARTVTSGFLMPAATLSKTWIPRTSRHHYGSIRLNP